MNYRELTASLAELRGRREAQAIVRLVMEERFGLSQTDLLLGKDTTLSANDHAELQKIANRLLLGEPVQYVLGWADFCGLRFKVNNDVLIPRPEIEGLIDRIEKAVATKADGKWDGLTIADLCTGSGCICTTLAVRHDRARVLGLDVSEEALEVARINAEELGVNVEFLRQDVLDVDATCANLPVCDVIVSNPPYIMPSEKSEMESTVIDFEPNIALFTPPDDPLLFYRAIANIAKKRLCKGGLIACEINASLHEETRKVFTDAGFSCTKIYPDCFGRNRILLAQ